MLKAFARFEQRLVAASGEDAFEVALAILAGRLVAELAKETFSPKRHLLLARKRFAELDLVSIRLDAKLLAYVLEPLAALSIVGSDLAPLDAALERLVARGSKGELGQYFTPRDVVELCVDALAPTKHDTVVDPACGSGGFLFAAAKRGAKCEGIDLGAKSFRVAQLLAHASGGVSVHRGDGLRTGTASSIVLMNPPFAGIITDRELLSKFEAPRGARASRDHLFLERAVQLMKPGGRAAIVVPQGILANASAAPLRKWLQSACRVRAVVGLHPHAFLPYTTVKTSILFLERTKERRSTLFLTSRRPGRDARGRETGTSDYVELGRLVGSFLGGKKIARGSIEEGEHERLDAEFWESGLRDLDGAVQKRAEHKIGDLVETEVPRFDKRRATAIDYVDISSVDGTHAVPQRVEAGRAPSRAQHLAKKGDVLVSTVRPERNVVALLDRPVVASSGFCLLRPKTVEPELLYAYCKTETFRRLLARRATASMYPVATYEDVKAIPFVMPTPAARKRIAARVARGIALVDEGQREIAAAIDEMEKAINRR